MTDWLVWSVSWALVLGGSVFVVAGGVGMIRFPDLYTRLHAASVTDTGGAIVLSLAMFVQAVFVFGDAMAAIKVVLILFFTLFTAPTASHALAKTALLSGLVPLGADGEPVLDSPEEAARLARSRADPDDPSGGGPDADRGDDPIEPEVDGGAAKDGAKDETRGMPR